MSFLVAIKVVASRPPERRPTGTPHAHANIVKTINQALSNYLQYLTKSHKGQKTYIILLLPLPKVNSCKVICASVQGEI